GERGCAREGDALAAVDGVPVGVDGHEGAVAGVLDPLCQLVQRIVPGDLLPGGGARRPVQDVFHAPRRGRQLHRGGALGAEPALVDRAVGVALDLYDLAALGVGDQGAADCAVGADRVALGGAADAEALLDLGGFGEVEAERREADPSGPSGPDLQEVTTGYR